MKQSGAFFAVNQKGMMMVLTFIVLATLTTVVTAFLYMNSALTRSRGWQVPSAQGGWIAEAGMQQALFQLKVNRDLVTPPLIESNFGAGRYSVSIDRIDYCIPGTAAASSQLAAQPARNANDNDEVTFWESNAVPSARTPQTLTIRFPDVRTLNRARFFLPNAPATFRPVDYSWQVSGNCTAFTNVVSRTNNALTDRTEAFAARTNVLCLRLSISRTGGSRSRIAIVEALGSRVTSVGTAGDERRRIQQSFVFDNALRRSYPQKDWNEIVPA